VAGKPGAIVSYGTEGSSGGKQAQLAQIADFVGIGLVGPGVRIPLPNEAYGADGRITDPATTSARTGQSWRNVSPDWSTQ
jgi:hypothetical protein